MRGWQYCLYVGYIRNNITTWLNWIKTGAESGAGEAVAKAAASGEEADEELQWENINCN